MIRFLFKLQLVKSVSITRCNKTWCEGSDTPGRRAIVWPSVSVCGPSCCSASGTVGTSLMDDRASSFTSGALQPEKSLWLAVQLSESVDDLTHSVQSVLIFQLCLFTSNFCYFLSDICSIELGYLSESCAHKKGLYLRIPEPSNFHFLNDEYRLLPPAGMESYFLFRMGTTYKLVGHQLWCFQHSGF